MPFFLLRFRVPVIRVELAVPPLTRHAMISPATTLRLLGLLLCLWAAATSPVHAAPPANDRFAAPVIVSGFPATASGSNTEATLEANEPLPSGLQAVAQGSVWFQWTAATAGPVRIDTIGSDFDTILAVWTGGSLASLKEVVSNDDINSGDLRSRVFFEVTAGVTYQIAVYGWSEDRGAISLRVAPDVSSRISGRITGPDGTTPLEGITASAYQWNATDGGGGEWEEVEAAFTDTGGRYIIRGLAAGTYRVRFSDFNSGDYRSEVFADAVSLEAGRDIVVAERTEITGIDASLTEASRLSGRVTGPDGTTPLNEIEVTAYQWNPQGENGGGRWEVIRTTESDAAGRYSLGGLSAGSYRVEFRDWATGEYAFEYFDDAAFLETGRDVVVPVATTVTGINASLATASRIAGRVTGPDGTTPIEGITASAYRWNARSGYWEWEEEGETDADGRYRISGLRTGTYRIEFFDWQREFMIQVFSGATVLDDGRDVVVATGATVTGINGALVPFSRISGRITGPDGTTPLEGIAVEAYQWNAEDDDWDWVSSATSDAAGRYTVGELTAGNYRLECADLPDGVYAVTVYPRAPDLYGGQDIVVPVASTVPGINVSMPRASRIAGRVTGPNGTSPVPDISVSAYRRSEAVGQGSGRWIWMWDAETSADGRYTLAGLPAGTYRVEFYDWLGEYSSEFYLDAADLESGRDIIVAAATTVTGIDASLSSSLPPTPPVITGFRSTGAGQFEILYTGTPGQRYTLQASTSLTSWLVVQEHTCQPGVNAIPVTSATATRFWRLSTTP